MYTELNVNNVSALLCQAAFGNQEHYQNMFHARRDDSKPAIYYLAPCMACQQ